MAGQNGSCSGRVAVSEIAKISVPQDPPAEEGRALSLSLRFLLLILCAFFSSWGAGLQKISAVDLSKIFPLCAVVLIGYWVVFERQRFRVFPRAFSLFMLFVVFHTLVTFVFFYPEEFVFGYGDAFDLGDGFIDAESYRGLAITRFFLFGVFSYATASLLRNRRELVVLSLSCSIGFVSSFVLGSRVLESELQETVRSTGGFLNPNSLGLAAMVSLFLCLFVIRCREARRSQKILASFLLLVSLYALLVSVARTSIMAGSVGLVLMILLEPLSRKFRAVLILCAVICGAVAFLPQHVTTSLRNRAVVDSRSGQRLPICRDYLEQFPRYAVTGVGLHRAVEVTRYSYTTRRLWIPHNTYLTVLVEFGLPGLLFFLAGMWSLWKRTVDPRAQRQEFPAYPAVAGLFAAWAVFFFAGTYGCRMFWLSWAVLAAYGSWRSRGANIGTVAQDRGKPCARLGKP